MSNAWSVGDGRWLGWINEHEGGDRDGSAWLFEPNTSQWIELPCAHDHQVWLATGLRNAGFASLGILLNGRQVSDYNGAALMINAFLRAKALRADWGYDAVWFRAAQEQRGITPCIPSKTNRKVPIPNDTAFYAQRHKV